MGYDFTKSKIFTTPSTNTMKETKNTNMTLADVCESGYSALLEHINTFNMGCETDNLEIMTESGSDLLRHMGNVLKSITDATNKILAKKLQAINTSLGMLKADSKYVKDVCERSAIYFNIEGYEYTIDSDIPNFKYIKDYVDKIKEDILKTPAISYDKAEDLITRVYDGNYIDEFRAKIIKEKVNAIIDSDYAYSDIVAAKYRNGQFNPIQLTIDNDEIKEMLEDIPELHKILKESIAQKNELTDIIEKYRKICDKSDSSWYNRHIEKCKGTTDEKQNIEAVNTYCNARIKEMTAILNAITMVYLEKFDAIKEATQLYSYIFKTVLNHFDEDDEVTMEALYTDYEALNEYASMTVEESYFEALLEADESSGDGKKVSWFRKLIEVVKALFDKFFNKNETMIANNEEWLAENKERILKGNYNGLKAKINARAEKDVKKTINALNKVKAVLNVTPSPEELKKLTSKEEVENYREFGKYKGKSESFIEGFKESIGLLAEEKIALVEDNNLKKVCGEYFARCESYKQTVADMKNVQSDFDIKLKKIEGELKRRGEALESSHNSLYINAPIVLEAEEKKEEDKKIKDEDIKVGQVVSDDREYAETGSLKYYRWATQLVQSAITAAMTMLEKQYIEELKLLKNVASELGGGAKKQTTTNNSSEKTEKKTNKKETSAKKVEKTKETNKPESGEKKGSFLKRIKNPFKKKEK